MKNHSRLLATLLTTSTFLALTLTLVCFVPLAAHAQKETLVYSFEVNGIDGIGPIGGVITDKQGNIYGTTSAGGTNNKGTVFEISGGKETILWNFGGPGDGAQPYAGLVRDPQGNLYGTTLTGGQFTVGTVFEVTGPNQEKVLVNFDETNGAGPFGGLIRDSAGNLYGLTSGGGAHFLGALFKVTPSGTEGVLYSFSGPPNDGAIAAGTPYMDSAGNIFGLTSIGGTGKQSFCTDGCGTVFEYSAAGKESVLYNFTGGADGASPAGGAFLIPDSKGNLYGTAAGGGIFTSPCPTSGCGVVFELSGKTETVLHAFKGASDGANPYSGLIRDTKNNLYGTTVNGGTNGAGTIYEVTSAKVERVIHDFPAQIGDGIVPLGALVSDGKGGAYGTTEGGGQFGGGTVYDIAP